MSLPSRQDMEFSAGYTANTYLDLLLSVPLAVAKTAYDINAGTFNKFNLPPPEWTKWDSVKEYVPLYKKREAIRQKWDTEPGVRYFQSNILGLVAFMTAGVPVAEATYSGLEKIIPQESQVLRNFTTSLSTAVAGYVAGNGAIILDYCLRVDRKNHLKPNGKFDWRKITLTSKSFIEGALSFDIPFFGGKLIGQTVMINQGMDPGPASATYDLAGIAAWHAVMCHIILRKSILVPKTIPPGFQKQGSWTDGIAKLYRKLCPTKATPEKDA